MDIHTGPESPAQIESMEHRGSMFSEIISSIQAGILITIPQWGNSQTTFLIGNQKVTESQVQCFIQTENLQMNTKDVMHSIFLDGDTQHLGEKFAHFLDGNKASCDDFIS